MPKLTSLVGYEQAVLSGLTGLIRRRVMSCLFEAAVPMTRRMIEVSTGIRISTVTPAVLSLMAAGLVKKAYDAKDPHSDCLAEFLEPVWPQPVQRAFDEFPGFERPTEYT